MGLSYAIVAYYFPHKISSMVALLEVMNGLGLMIGPPIGGFLYELGLVYFMFDLSFDLYVISYLEVFVYRLSSWELLSY